MNGLVVLIPIALLLGLAGLGAFFWSVKSGQFEDMDGAAMRVLIDDEAPAEAPDERSDRGRLG
nr:cbb3-type cytochrome oxidase assembly protein CcoS [uncultured Sphingomonas sp.]